MTIHQNPIGYAIICGVVILIIALNISLITALKNKRNDKPMDIYQSVYDRSKSPWQPEDEALTELSKMVEQIKTDKNDEEGTNGDSTQNPIDK